MPDSANPTLATTAILCIIRALFLKSSVSMPSLAANQLSNRVTQLCHEAGRAIMDVYEHLDGFTVDTKADRSPVTAADLAAHDILLAGLSDLLADTPVLSEEDAIPAWSERRQWTRYWLIDPLDGTKEFVERGGEFTVNVALIENGEPVLGVVYVPTLGVTYIGSRALGAWKTVASEGNTKHKLQTRPLPASGITLVASRRHGNDALPPLLDHLQRVQGKVELQNIGSSLKLCLVAEGKADLYPRLSPTCEWDTAAAQAVVEAAGGKVLGANGLPLRYNQQDSLLNGAFYVVGDSSADWAHLLALVE